MIESFGDRLRERVRERGPLCVGVDPSGSLLQSWGRRDDVEGLEFFSLAVLEAVAGVAVAIKPQVAYFERFGSQGFRVLERLLGEARDADVLVIADAKRGDVSVTNEGYAQAWLHDGSPLAVDALTASPYVGFGALAPLFDAAEQSGRGVFVLAATSNIEGRAIQRARTSEHEYVEDAVLQCVADRNRAFASGRLGAIGAVLGATRDRPSFDLSTLDGPYLVPGVGAQGADAMDVARLVQGAREGTVLVSISRAILQRGPERRGLRDASERWRDNLLGFL
ncbi:MAG: orotidine-5'-phosphate decarboxylase [Acidimicrobiales bacterium]